MLSFDTFCRISFDEGRQWTRHSFSAMQLFVDGVLVEAGAENQIMTWVFVVDKWINENKED